MVFKQRKRISRIKLLLPAALGVLAFVRPESAHAYLDPGTGSMLLQALIGGIAMALGAISIYWARVRTFFADRFGKSKAQAETGDDKPSPP